MKFSYEARDKNGKLFSGEVDAASKLEAADKIFNEKGLSVIEIKKSETPEKNSQDAAESAENIEEATRLHIGSAKSFVRKKETKKNENLREHFESINKYLISVSPVSPKEKAVFFRLFAVMINAGIPIVKSLKILRDQLENKRLKMILTDVSERVEEGESFSKSLSDHIIFTEAEIGMIASGEESGQLNKTLEELAQETEKSASLKSKIKSAMIYPVVILSILVAATIIVMTLVVPKLAELFATSGADLPTSTQILMSISNWFMANWFLIPNWLFFILLIFGAVFSIKIFKKTEFGKMKWDQLMIHLPLFGELHQKVALSTFSRQIALLIGSGVSITRSLEISGNAVENSVYSKKIHEIRNQVEKGVSIHKVIENDKLFPSLITSMIAVGEQSAQLGNISQKVADFYDDEVDSFVKNLSTIMEPLIIVLVGLLVGGLVIAIMQPIMQIADVATS